MFNVILPRVLWIIGLVLAHTLVFNHIHLMGYATPMPYVYALIILPHGTARWIYVVLGFCIGIVIDILSNTVGAAAAALTLVGLLTPLLLRTFAPDDKLEEEFTPSIKTMQWGGFLKLAVVVTLFDAIEILIKVGSSTALTVIFMMTFEKLRNTSRNT